MPVSVTPGFAGRSSSHWPQGRLLQRRPRVAGFTLIEFLVVLAILAVLVTFLLPAHRGSREPTRRMECSNHLKQIVLALHNYSDRYQCLPPPYTVDAEGRRLHSWRTLILPFADEQPLYDSIDLSKPWDDPANAAALKATPRLYQCPSNPQGAGETTYLAVVASSSLFAQGMLHPKAGPYDSLSHTMLVIEVDHGHGVPWTSPQDADELRVLSLTKGSPLPHQQGPWVAYGDGSVRVLAPDTPAALRHALITASGGEVIAD